jgi:hypothetical protein
MIATVAPTTPDVVTGTGLRGAWLVMSPARRLTARAPHAKACKAGTLQTREHPFVLSDSTRGVADLGGEVGVERPSRDEPRAERDERGDRDRRTDSHEMQSIRCGRGRT